MARRGGSGSGSSWREKREEEGRRVGGRLGFWGEEGNRLHDDEGVLVDFEFLVGRGFF
jgi:hypothetical protein